MKNILIIDDEEKLRSLLARIVSLEGFEVLQAGTGKAGLKMLEQHEVDVVLCDVKLPDSHGVELARSIHEKYPITEVILLTAYGNIPDGVQAIKNGAFDYITKGDENHRIIPLLYRAMEKVALARRVQKLENQIGQRHQFENIIGQSNAIRQVIDAAQKVAHTNATVLLTGETGTGKEVFAQAIHQNSVRHRKSFVAVNCAAFSKELLENELFGHRAGAFTGAIKDTNGIFEEANSGTVFLDEMGEMPPDLQAKLLRVLETGSFLKVGDSKLTQVDVRIIAATNRNLQTEVEAGRFREDLFYRLSVFTIHLPPLRERKEDIPLLADSFLVQLAAKTRKKMSGMSATYLAALQNHTWKGNIRELRNVMERSIILTDADILEVDTLPLDFNRESVSELPDSLDLAAAEKAHIQKVFRQTGGNKTETARVLNIALTTLYRKLEEYKIP